MASLPLLRIAQDCVVFHIITLIMGKSKLMPPVSSGQTRVDFRRWSGILGTSFLSI